MACRLCRTDLSQLPDRFAAVEQILGPSGVIGNGGGAHVDAELPIECGEHVLIVNGSVLRHFSQAIRRADDLTHPRGTIDGRVQRKLSNKTHRSRTDPDATLAQKRGTPQQLKYRVHQTIDADSRSEKRQQEVDVSNTPDWPARRRTYVLLRASFAHVCRGVTLWGSHFDNLDFHPGIYLTPSAWPLERMLLQPRASLPRKAKPTEKRRRLSVQVENTRMLSPSGRRAISP